MDNSEAVLHQLWETELEIMDVIHKVCVENHLTYSLAHGTAIGAVRHKGFIPWDDDIDICMPRSDYEKLLSIWNDVAPEGYFVQNLRTDSDFTQTFTKIRKDHTAFIHDDEEKAKKYHKGIFVDILPRDRVAASPIARKLQFFACAVFLLYAREKESGTGGIVSVAEKLLLHLPKKWHPVLRNRAEMFIRKWNECSENLLFFPSTIIASKRYFPPNLFDHTELADFCDRKYFCLSPQNMDAQLRAEYGDYMQLPPEEERVWKHHPIILDFEHNYEELEST